MTTGRKDDAGKLRWGLLRKSLVLPLEAVIRVLMYGANKYGDDNWQQVDNPLARYRDALDRHLADIDRGVIVDPDTGENNYAHVATNALFLLWFYLTDNKTAGQEETPENEWKTAVDHELSVLHTTADSFAHPAAAVRALIDWHTSVERDHAADLKALREEAAALREALIGLLPWVPSSATYRGLGFDPEAPEQALRRARAALEYGCDDD